MELFIDETSQTVYIVLQNPDGSPATGLNEGSITMSYTRDRAAATSITPAAQTPTGAWTSGGFCEISSSLAPGVYRVDVPNAMAATGVDNATLSVVSSGDLPCNQRFALITRVTVIAGKVPATVAAGDLANDTITAATIATGAFTATKFAAGAFDAVWSVTTRTLSSISALATELQTALGLSSANLDTQLSSLSSGQTTINNNILAVLARMIDKTITSGAVAADAGNTSATFKTNLSSSTNDHWKETFIQLTSGTLDGAIRKVDSYNGTTKFITVSPAFPSTPANGVTFSVINR